MALIKYYKADLRAKYMRVYEIGLIISLALLIVAFKYYPRLGAVSIMQEKPPVLFKLENIVQTRQQLRPPPPKPQIPIAAPSEEILENVNIKTSDLNLNEKLPPPIVRKEKRMEDESPYFTVVEELPEPVGGIAAIENKIVYPELAVKAGVEGRVFVEAFVDKNGDVTKITLIKGIGAGCDEAAMKAVRETKFNPGKQRGKPVNVRLTIPVDFRLK